MRSATILLVLLGSLARPGAAQMTTSTVLRVPERIIEILGLRRSTPAMIQDSMDVHAPGDSLHSGGCAATLRYDLGFAEAASFMAKLPGDDKPYNVILVIEPQDSGLVRHRPAVRDTTGTQTPWAPLVAWIRTRERLVELAVVVRLEARGQGRTPAVPAALRTDSAIVRQI